MTRRFAALVLPASLMAASAQAATVAHGDTRVIPYADRDLTSEAGLKDVLRRIDVAAAQLCRDANGPSLAGTHSRACRAEVVGRAHDQLADAVLRARD